MSHEVDDLYNMIRELEERVSALIELAQSVEWVDDECPACGRGREHIEYYDHADDCALGRLRD